MTMTDMLLQMTLQNTWQMTQVSQSAGQSASTQNQQTGTSFQDLLNQRRDDLTQTGDKTTDLKDPKDDQTVDTTTGKTEQEPQNGAVEAAAAAVAPMLLNDLTPVPANFVEETGVGNQTIQAVTMEAVMPDAQTVQTAAQVQAQPQTGTVLPQVQQEAVQTQPANQQTTFQTTVSDGQAAQAAAPQANEVAVQTTAAQSGAQEDLSQNMTQDLTQSAAPQTGSDELQDMTVESFQTPLFQNVETTPVRVGDGEAVDMAAPTQEVDQSLGDMLKTALDDGQQHLEIKLSPANLGTVTAEFTRTPEGVLHVVLHAQSEQTARLLSDHASSLGMILQDSNHGEVRVQVAQPQENQSAWQHPDQESGNQQQSHQQQQQQQRNTPRQEAETFLHQLRLGLVQRETDAV